MSVIKTEVKRVTPLPIADNVFEVETVSEEQLDTDKLKALKEKMAKKEDMPPKIIEKKTKSIRLGVVGSGQAGSRLAETFHTLGYDAVVFNTAPQDLEHIKLPEANKCLLEYGLGGAAKEMEIGKEAAESHRDAINELIQDKLSDAQAFVLCLSLGGGSGAGSCEVFVDLLSGIGKPVVVMTVLPMANDDAQTKRNALETLSKLAKEAQNKRIHNLIVVDNAKIETIYSDVSQIDFFEVSNRAIVDPVDAFNTLSSMSSSVKGLDPMEFAKLLTDGGGLTVYGELTVPNYEDETAIAEAVINNLNSGLLASGFDLKQSKYVGVMIVANREVWSKIPSASVSYAMSMVHDLCGTPTGIFRGIYTTDMDSDVVKVYSMFSGLGLPDPRVQQLKKEAQEYAAKTKDKDVERNLTLKLDTGTEETVSAADKIKQKIATKKSAFGGLVSSSINDRRKK
jgi:cell division GTPase FtsZ